MPHPPGDVADNPSSGGAELIERHGCALPSVAQDDEVSLHLYARTSSRRFRVGSVLMDFPDLRWASRRS